MKRFIIVGLGTFGSAVAEALQGMGHDVAGLDMDPERVDQMGGIITAAGVGDGTEARTLRRIGAEGGGVGPMTIAALMKNTYRSCLERHG